MKREVNMRKPDTKLTMSKAGADMRSDERINTDPNGMWTGVSTEYTFEPPVQDVDDL